MRTTQTLPVVLASLAVLVTACGAADAGGDLPEIGPVPTVAVHADVVLPFDAYELSAEQDRQVLQANHALLTRCGARFGVEITMPIGENPTPEESNGRRYGLVDSEYASSHGYNAPPIAADVNGRKSEGGWNPSADELLVLDGPRPDSSDIPRDPDGTPVPEGGCLGIVEGQFPSMPPKVDTHEVELNKKAEADPRVRTAKRAWVKCMSDLGYDYDDPWDPNESDWPDPVTQREIDTALDDLGCRRETNLNGIWLAVESAYQRQEIESNPEGFADLKEWHDARIKSAARVLQGER